MIPPHSKDFGFPRDYSLQREAAISCNRGLEKRAVEVVQSHNTWKNEPSYTFQNGFKQQKSRNGIPGIQTRFPLPGTCRKYSKDFPQRDILQRTYDRQEMEPEITYSDHLRLMRTGNPTRFPSGFTPLRHQQISDQESLCFPIQDTIQERKRIIGKEQDFFPQEDERVRSYDPEIAGSFARSTKKQQTVVNTSNEPSIPMIRNDIFTQMKQNFVIPESTISSNTLCLQFLQFVEQIQKEFERLHESISRLQDVYTLQTKTIHSLQEDYTELYKASEDSKRRLNQVLEEQNHCKRGREHLD
ncbi:hypothetical protein O181_058163 [Austropuccinia psidii MF-1]|uniref:Uncharacterized protein n=1 Tax=Austropuccinia psidii MF-1 TaxID=1389203 RepID=A0A9Q3ECL2_9BASI|nr:hypothetical protein [Austropuccinia psidii MF-1]